MKVLKVGDYYFDLSYFRKKWVSSLIKYYNKNQIEKNNYFCETKENDEELIDYILTNSEINDYQKSSVSHKSEDLPSSIDLFYTKHEIVEI